MSHVIYQQAPTADILFARMSRSGQCIGQDTN